MKDIANQSVIRAMKINMSGNGHKALGHGKDKSNMWRYEKRLQYPVEIKRPDPKLAKMIISQLGGPDGEMGASMRYLNQRYAMPYPNVAALLTDIGTEEYVHRGWKQKQLPLKETELK